MDVLKLWKGLFYAVWMCDRPLPQQALCAELAELVHAMPPAAVGLWLRGFWSTMSREWTSIDALRLNKFMLLVRRVFAASLAWMKADRDQDGAANAAKKTKKRKKVVARWDDQRVDDMLEVLAQWPFVLEEEVRDDPEDEEDDDEEEDEDDEDKFPSQHVPAGLKLHVLDIWIDELEKAGLIEPEEDDQQAADILRRITELVELLQDRTINKAVRIRCKQSLADERLLEKKAGEEDGD